MRKGRKDLGISIYLAQLALVAALSSAWWGILYPDLNIAGETVEAVSEETKEPVSGETKEAVPEETKEAPEPDPLESGNSFFEILDAEKGEIIIGFKILELFRE